MPSLTAVTLGQFARELVLQLENLPDLLQSWNLTNEDYEELRKSKFFQNELKQAVEEVKAMGPDAGFITRAKILSETFLEDMVKIMGSSTVPAEVKVKLFEQMTNLARLHAPKAQPTREAGPAGPQVVFNFGAGMPGLPVVLEAAQDPKTALPAPEQT